MLLENFRQDVRIGLRVLRREKGFCALAVLVLALGICAVTTMFSVVNGTLLRGFSFPHADRLTSIQFVDPKQNTFFGVASQLYSLDYEEVRAGQRSFEFTAAYIFGSTVNLTVRGEPRRYTGAYITEDFFRALGVAPVIGRDFTAADNRPGAEKVTVISHAVWVRDFGRDPQIVGTAVRINGRTATIIGVMPPGFAFPQNEELWTPLFNEFPPRPRTDRGAQGATPAVLGLIKPGVSLAQANQEVTAFAARLAQAFPDTNQAYAVGEVRPLLETFIPRPIRGLLYSMLAVCAGVLLLACSNVMNMQFARAVLRAKELAIRSSLGASRGRLIRQMLTESLLVATLGAALGVPGAYYLADLLLPTVRAMPNPIPAFITFDLDVTVLGGVVLITMTAALASGVLPAWMASRANAAEALKDAGRGTTSRTILLITRGLVVFQIVVSCVILIASLLQAQVIVRQLKIDYGYDTNALLTARLGLMDGDYPDGAARRQFYDRLLRHLRAAPEIEQVALTSRIRMAFAGNGRIEIEGRTYQEDRDRPNVNIESVTDGYFSTLGVKLREGRDFNADDLDARLPVAIVTAGFAQRYYPGESAIGRRFRTVGLRGQFAGPWRTIVGVVADVRMLGPFNNPNVEEVGFYLPFYSVPFGPVSSAPFALQFATIVVKPRQGPPAAYALPLRREVTKVDPYLPLYFVGTPKDNIESFLAQNRVIAIMFTIFGAVAAGLAAIGLYGVMSFSVNQRTQEFGIRLALGAEHRRILGLVLRQGATQIAVGLGLGLGTAVLLALVGGQGLRNSLANIISPTDPATYTAVTLLLTLVALVAALFPALRATRVDPLVALRAE